MSGWFAIHRDIFASPMFSKEPMSEREAWIWLIANAAWRDTSHRIGSTMHDVERGSLFITLRDLSAAFGWGSDTKVRRFLDLLESQSMIERKTNAGKTQIKLINYDKYQDVTRDCDVEKTHGKRNENAEKTQEKRTENAQKTQEKRKNYDEYQQVTNECDARKTQEKRTGDLEKTQKKRTKITIEQINNISPLIPQIGGEEEFEIFWKAYPKRHTTAANPKEPARKKFLSACKSGVDPNEIIAGAKAYAAEEAKSGNVGTQYIAQASTWLSQRRWQDYNCQQAEAKPNPEAPTVFVEDGSKAWMAWRNYHLAKGEQPKKPMQMRQGVGAWFHSELPPN